MKESSSLTLKHFSVSVKGGGGDNIAADIQKQFKMSFTYKGQLDIWLSVKMNQDAIQLSKR